MTEIRGMTILLTGASGGLGHTIARTLARRGGRLVLTGRRADLLEPLAREVGGAALVVDLSQPDAPQQLVEQAGAVDILVSNAGLPGSGMLDDYTMEQLDRALDVNLRAPIVLAKLLSEQMVRRRRGHLVFMSSLSAKSAGPASSLYSATKFGLRGFALALREDLLEHNVGVSTIFPSFISGPGLFGDSGAALPRGVGTKTSQDVANAVVKAIEKNAAEIDVAPLSLRVGATLAGVVPRTASAVSRRLGSVEVAQRIADGQIRKR